MQLYAEEGDLSEQTLNYKLEAFTVHLPLDIKHIYNTSNCHFSVVS